MFFSREERKTFPVRNAKTFFEGFLSAEKAGKIKNPARFPCKSGEKVV